MQIDNEFTEAIQRRCARIAVSSSAVRGQRVPGLAAAARANLAVLPLAQFGISKPRLFKLRLDRATDDLVRALPKGARIK